MKATAEKTRLIMNDMYFYKATFSEEINLFTKNIIDNIFGQSKAARAVLGATDKINRKIQTY